MSATTLRALGAAVVLLLEAARGLAAQPASWPDSFVAPT